MELPEGIRREIEESRNRDTILNVVSQLQSDGVKITRDRSHDNPTHSQHHRRFRDSRSHTRSYHHPYA